MKVFRVEAESRAAVELRVVYYLKEIRVVQFGSSIVWFDNATTEEAQDIHMDSSIKVKQ